MSHRAVDLSVWPKGCHHGKYMLPIAFPLGMLFLDVALFPAL